MTATKSPEQGLPPVAPATREVVTANSDEVYELLCDAQRSIRYHRAREAFFRSWSNLFSYISLLAGSGVVVTLLAQAPVIYSMIAGGLVAATQAIEIVGRLSDKANAHNSFASEFTLIERSGTIAGDLTTEQLRNLKGEMLSIEVREPPIKRYLDLRCHNEVARATGSDDVERLTWFQRRFIHYLNGDRAGYNPKTRSS